MTAWVPDVELDVVLVASLCGLGFVAASLLWHLHVRPDLVLSLWRPAPLSPTSVAWMVAGVGQPGEALADKCVFVFRLSGPHRLASLGSRPRVCAPWSRRRSFNFSWAARTASLMFPEGGKAKPSAGESCVFNG